MNFSSETTAGNKTNRDLYFVTTRWNVNKTFHVNNTVRVILFVYQPLVEEFHQDLKKVGLLEKFQTRRYISLWSELDALILSISSIRLDNQMTMWVTLLIKDLCFSQLLSIGILLTMSSIWFLQFFLLCADKIFCIPSHIY